MKIFSKNHVDRFLMVFLVMGLWVFILFGHIGEAQKVIPYNNVDAEKVSGLEEFIQEIVEDCEVMVLNLGVTTTIDCS